MSLLNNEDEKAHGKVLKASVHTGGGKTLLKKSITLEHSPATFGCLKETVWLANGEVLINQKECDIPFILPGFTSG